MYYAVGVKCQYIKIICHLRQLIDILYYNIYIYILANHIISIVILAIQRTCSMWSHKGEVSHHLKMKRMIIIISILGNLSKPSLIYPSLFKSIYFIQLNQLKYSIFNKIHTKDTSLFKVKQRGCAGLQLVFSKMRTVISGSVFLNFSDILPRSLPL